MLACAVSLLFDHMSVRRVTSGGYRTAAVAPVVATITTTSTLICQQLQGLLENCWAAGCASGRVGEDGLTNEFSA